MKCQNPQQTLFKMFRADLLKDHDLGQTIKLGLAFYLAMAMLATPSAICSLQHQISQPSKRWPVPPLYDTTGFITSQIVAHTTESAALLADSLSPAHHQGVADLSGGRSVDPGCYHGRVELQSPGGLSQRGTGFDAADAHHGQISGGK